MAEVAEQEVAPPVAATQGTKMDEWTPRVVQRLSRFFGEENVERVRTLLQETGGLVSGGFVLLASIEYGGAVLDKTDIDIYVPTKNIPQFIRGIFRGEDPIFRPDSYRYYSASFYCKSFLRKNGIRKVYRFNKHGDTRARPPIETKSIDIMSVRNKRTPLAVVNNFDLTFCQVWYDGDAVYASHPDDITNRTGKLQNDYCKALLEGNRFLKERIGKYVQRGFKISFDPSCIDPDSIISSIVDRDYKPACTKEGYQEEPSYLERWFQRVATRWFIGYRDYNLDRDDGQRRIDQESNALIIPLYNDSCNKDKDFAGCVATWGQNLDILGPNEGYDSDDFTEEVGTELAVRNYVSPGPELAAEADVNKMKYLRELTSLFLNTNRKIRVRKSVYNIVRLIGGNINDNPPPQPDGNGRTLFTLFKGLKSRCLKVGDDFVGNTGPIYHIHNHPMDAGITQEGLEGYLETVMLAENVDRLPCYHKPEPVAAGAPPNPRNCNQPLTLRQVQPIVTREFYRRLIEPRPTKDGLDQEVQNFELVFRNSKSPDPQYGDIYHVTMCPYCLLFVERGEGCAYMVHDNPNGLPSEHAPFCKGARVVEAIRKKYVALARNLDGGLVHLEFCVECGRPCHGHKHFNLEGTAMIRNQVVPDPLLPGQQMIDYGNCPGGGRVEMVARMLAVISVYKDKTFRNTREERRVAAILADEAPRIAEFTDRARQILAKAPADRRWNVYVPRSKRYDNPLYADVQDNAAWDTVIPAEDIAPAGELVPAQNPDPVANAANAAAANPNADANAKANADANAKANAAANAPQNPLQGGRIRKTTFKKKTRYLPLKRKSTAKKNSRH